MRRSIRNYFAIAAVAIMTSVSVALVWQGSDVSVPQPRDSIVRIETSAGLGSGVVIAPNLIITNAHVVEENSTVLVTLESGFRTNGTVLWRGKYADGHDLALVRVEKRGLTPVRIDCAYSPKVGDAVIALGMPAGMGWTQTRGYVAAVDRAGSELPGGGMPGYKNLIHLDMTIIGGNSGGGLFTLDGRFIGIPTLALRSAPHGFAISAKTVCMFLGRSA